MQTTCSECPYLKFKSDNHVCVAFCEQLNEVVPHHADLSSNGKFWNATFWRVLEHCPESHDDDHTELEYMEIPA